MYFKAGLIIESALAKVLSNLLCVSDSGFVSVFLLFDLNAACYSNDLAVLLDRLHKHAWLRSYFTD